MYRNLFIIITLCLSLYLPAFCQQDGISLQATLDKRTITIGDLLNYSLTFTHPENLKFIEPDKTKEMEQWTIKDIHYSQEVQSKKIIDRINYTLTTFTTGEVLIPEIIFNFKDNNNQNTQVKTQNLKINVESVLQKYGNTGTIRDIKPPMNIKYPAIIYLFWLAVVLIIITGFVLWYNKYKKRSNKLSAEALAPKRPPSEIAMEELLKLKSSNLINEGRIKEFYIALSDIIRDYISAIYSIEARDRTTSEMYSDLRKKEPDKKILNFIKEFFDECDLVKFAKYRPDEKICLKDWESAKSIVV